MMLLYTRNHYLRETILVINTSGRLCNPVSSTAAPASTSGPGVIDVAELLQQMRSRAGTGSAFNADDVQERKRAALGRWRGLEDAGDISASLH